MSLVTALIPAEAAFASTIAAARPLVGLGLLAAALIVFKPLLSGLLRAVLLVIQPRQTQEQRNARERRAGLRMMARMARDMERVQPGLAAELRSIAARY